MLWLAYILNFRPNKILFIFGPKISKIWCFWYRSSKINIKFQKNQHCLVYIPNFRSIGVLLIFGPRIPKIGTLGKGKEIRKTNTKFQVNWSIFNFWKIAFIRKHSKNSSVQKGPVFLNVLKIACDNNVCDNKKKQIDTNIILCVTPG